MHMGWKIKKDTMKRLYAPWRHDYVTNSSKPERQHDASAEDCVFCQQVMANEDDHYLIIKRYQHCFVMMNSYPYNVGHIMILPYEHKPSLNELSPVIRAEMIEVLSLSEGILKKVLKTEGFNIGINLGVAGGGGIPSHLHIHVLPRWRGDTNFLETLGGIKLLTTDIDTTYQDLKEGFAPMSL